MKIKLFIFLILLNTTILFSQKKLYTHIASNKKNYCAKSYQLARVIDNRTTKNTIGKTYTSSRTVQHEVDFKSAVSNELFLFYNTNFHNALHPCNQFLVIVNQFEIGHVLSNQREDTGYVFLNFDFYNLKNDSAFFLYNYAKKFNELSESVLLTHPKRINQALLNAFAHLDFYFPTKLTDTVTHYKKGNYNKTLSDSILNMQYGLTIQNFLKQDSASNYKSSVPSFYFFFVGAIANASRTYITTHINANLVFQIKKAPKYLVGIQANYFVYGIMSKQIIPVNSSYQLFNYDIGVRILRQLKNKLFLNVNPQLLTGNENIRYTILPSNYSGTSATETIDFKGFQMDIGVYYFRPQQQGIYFGGDIFYRETSSNIITKGIGLKFNFGVKF